MINRVYGTNKGTAKRKFRGDKGRFRIKKKYNNHAIMKELLYILLFL